MTVGEIKDEVIKLLGNSLAVSGHPFISPTDYVYRWITRAANRIPRMASAGGRDILTTFPELFGTFKAQTSNGIAWLDRPAAALVIREVYSFDKTGANADVDPVRLVPELLPADFDMGRPTAATAPTGFPSVCKIAGNRIYFRPTPVTAYLTDTHLYGIKRESVVFNNDAQTPMLGEDWHEAISFEAAAIGATSLGYFERAKIFRGEVGVLVGIGVDVAAQEDLYDDPTFELAGVLTQEDVYS